jgi:outer membrane protein
MNKFFKLLFTAAIVLTAAVSLNAQKIAHIHLDSLLVLMPETKKADADAQDYNKQLEQHMQQMQSEYQNKVDYYEKNKATMSDLIRQATENDIQRMQQSIQEFQQNAQTDFQNKKNDLLKPIYTKANQAISEVAKSSGYKYVFDTSSGAVIYYDTSDNILAAVKAKLGIPANAIPFNNAKTNDQAQPPAKKAPATAPK